MIFEILYRVNTNTGCWNWAGYKLPSGYGRYGGRYAHHLSWEIHRGSIPKGMFVLHRCDNPRCVNPDHLFLGTQKENMKDKVNKNRQHRMFGADNPNTKLTEQEVSKIRKLKGVKTYRQIGELFNVYPQHIYRIMKGIRK